MTSLQFGKITVQQFKPGFAFARNSTKPPEAIYVVTECPGPENGMVFPSSISVPYVVRAYKQQEKDTSYRFQGRHQHASMWFSRDNENDSYSPVDVKKFKLLGPKLSIVG